MPIEQEHLESVLKNELIQNNVSFVKDLRSEPAVGPGENFASLLTRVTLDIVLGNGKLEKSSVILKEFPKCESKLSFFENNSFYKTEEYMYEEILPRIEEVLNEQNIPPLWAKYLGKHDDNIIFSDLKKRNYSIQCRLKRLDMEHTLLTVRTLALFHSASVVLKHRGQLDTSALNEMYFLKDTPSMVALITSGIKIGAEVIINEWGPEWSDIGKRILSRADTWHDDIVKIGRVDESRFNVICHGDVWTNNIMFKYTKTMESPIGVKFVDFQLSHYNSFAFDLVYFMATSLKPEFRRNNKKAMLKAYWSTLKDSLEYYGLGHLTPSLDTIEAELKRIALMHFALMLSLFPVFIATVPEPLSVDAITSGVISKYAYNMDIFRGTYRQEVEADLLEMAEDGLF